MYTLPYCAQPHKCNSLFKACPVCRSLDPFYPNPCASQQSIFEEEHWTHVVGSQYCQLDIFSKCLGPPLFQQTALVRPLIALTLTITLMGHLTNGQFVGLMGGQTNGRCPCPSTHRRQFQSPELVPLKASESRCFVFFPSSPIWKQIALFAEMKKNK